MKKTNMKNVTKTKKKFNRNEINKLTKNNGNEIKTLNKNCKTGNKH